MSNSQKKSGSSVLNSKCEGTEAGQGSVYSGKCKQTRMSQSVDVRGREGVALNEIGGTGQRQPVLGLTDSSF